jgi:hypothetical protein
VFVEDRSQLKLNCKTEKDRGGERLNNRTAGKAHTITHIYTFYALNSAQELWLECGLVVS